ncbi:hypothetical protein [Arthrobacter sp. NPDC056493]|uniref:hypothetical protein n=1 Tax=Arthrobacter sp. NPDC056493 TaxID=3345839 RepID=UPI00366E2C0D
MSTEETGHDRQQTGDGVPNADKGVAVGAGEPNTFEPEEGTGSLGATAPSDDQIATAEDTPDVEETPVDTTEPS